jgi:hypothetical protein
MVNEVRIYGIVDKAIIHSIKKANNGLLRKTIRKKVHELTKENDGVILKRIEKFYKLNYLIRKSRGIYAVNPDFEFVFEGEPLPSEDKIAEVPSQRCEAHTADLKEAIKIWMKNFPDPPGSTSGQAFLYSVGKCEEHPLYSDLSNHLLQTGFDACDRWRRYKVGAMELDRQKKELLIAIENAISDIFPGPELKFANFFDPTLNHDFDISGLNDFECSFPNLIQEYLLYGFYIPNVDLAETQEEREVIDHDISLISSYWNDMEERVRNLPVTVYGNSILWGQDRDMELMRVPSDYLDSLNQGKENAIAFFFNRSETINDKVKNIFRKFEVLITQKEDLIEELNRSLYCQCFSGNCRYLG